MDNRHRAESLPKPTKESPGYYLRNAVNVQFDALGNVSRVDGATKIYSGTDVHSWYATGDTSKGYFIEGSDLKRLENDNTATTLATIGASPAGYTRIGERVYCGNGVGGYVIDGDNVTSLGIDWPEQQPVLVARDTGGMYAGDYQVAITYLRNGEESGCGQASRITLTEGQGIYFQMPTVPSEIDTIAVWVSSVNDDGLYLYDEVDASTTEVFIDNNISSIRLETQFMYPPIPTRTITAHYGRIWWADGDILRCTEPLKYGFTKSGNYARFGADISLVVSVPGSLYVCADKTYRISNIDSEGFIQRTEVLPYGAVEGSLRYDERSKTAFWQSHKGFVAASTEGVAELVADVIAMPKYDKGTLTLTEINGIRQLICVSQGGETSNLMDRQFQSEEVTRIGKAL